MDLSNPFILIIIVTSSILVLILLINFFGGAKSASLKTKWFSFEKKNDSVADDEVFKVKLDSLAKEVQLSNDRAADLLLEVRALKKTLRYLEDKDKLKYEYKAKSYKITKKLFIQMLSDVEKSFKERLGQKEAIDIRYLDEYKLILYIIKEINHIIIKKFMDDFDTNGFSSVGFSADGEFSQKLLSQYLESKPSELEQDVKNILLISLDRPLTVITDEGLPLKIIERNIIITSSEIEKIILSNLFSVKLDIIDVYDFIITKYKRINNEYESGSCDDEE